MLSAWNPVCQIMACSKFLWASYKPLKNGACSRNTGRATTAAALTCYFALAWWSPASSPPPLPQQHFGFSEGLVESLKWLHLPPPSLGTGTLLSMGSCSLLWFLCSPSGNIHLPLRSVVYPVVLNPTVGLWLSTLAAEMSFPGTPQWLPTRWLWTTICSEGKWRFRGGRKFWKEENHNWE